MRYAWTHKLQFSGPTVYCLYCAIGIAIEIIDIECVLGNLAGTQIEKKIALINPPCWICPRSALCELQWGEFNLPL